MNYKLPIESALIQHYNQENRKKRGRFDGTTEGNISAIQTVKNGFEVEETKTQQHYHGDRDNDIGLALLHLHVSLCQVATGDAIRRDDALSRDRRTFLYSSPLPADEGAFLFREA